jgi:ABC-type phosphate/phosphonate transport system substrate-binding protein
VRTLAGRVRVVATPSYDFPGCDGIWHRSFLVARAGDGLRGRAEPAGLAELRGRRCSYNGPDSNSGMNLLRATLAPIARGAPMLGGLIETGAHLNSLAAVRDGAADFAAIDCVSHAFVARARPELVRGLCVLAWTPASPALPLITGAGTTDAEFAALRQVIADPGLRPLWRALGVRALAFTAFDTYAPVTALARAAAESLYPELA